MTGRSPAYPDNENSDRHWIDALVQPLQALVQGKSRLQSNRRVAIFNNHSDGCAPSAVYTNYLTNYEDLLFPPPEICLYFCCQIYPFLLAFGVLLSNFFESS